MNCAVPPLAIIKIEAVLKAVDAIFGCVAHNDARATAYAPCTPLYPTKGN